MGSKDKGGKETKKEAKLSPKEKKQAKKDKKNNRTQALSHPRQADKGRRAEDRGQPTTVSNTQTAAPACRGLRSQIVISAPLATRPIICH